MKIKAIFIGMVILCLAFGGAARYYYGFPKFFEVTIRDKEKGTVYPETLYLIADDMVSNWMPNDIFFWPTNLLDNPQNFQLGELEALRYAIRVLRDNFSRMRTTDEIDPDCDIAFVGFSNDPYRLFWPRTENKYREGLQGLERYRDKLARGNAHFYPRADNLHEFIKQFLSLLGGASQRLANAPRDKRRRISEETLGDPTLQGEQQIAYLTPWMKIDDNFYYTRGLLFVVRQIMVAIKYDFELTIERRHASELLDAIIEILDLTQFEPWIVVNGKTGSLLANHSLQLQARLEDARQKMRSLQSILEQ